MSYNQRLCKEYGGSFRYTDEPYGSHCYMYRERVKIVTDGQSCSELGGTVHDNVCRIPIENMSLIERREHPTYERKELDQETYEVLVEEAQIEELSVALSNTESEEEKQKILDTPVDEMFVATHGYGVHRGEHAEEWEDCDKIRLSWKTFMMEAPAKDRLAWKWYGKDYYSLDADKKRRIRYRTNKQISDLK